MSTKTVTEEKVTTGIKINEKLEIKPPKTYKVILYNNQVTLHALVKEVLQHVFGIHGTKAFIIMRTAEAQGLAIVMVAPEDIAKRKTQDAIDYKNSLAGDYEGKAEELLFECLPND